MKSEGFRAVALNISILLIFLHFSSFNEKDAHAFMLTHQELLYSDIFV